MWCPNSFGVSLLASGAMLRAMHVFPGKYFDRRQVLELLIATRSQRHQTICLNSNQ
jgi:hypothetical protein